MQQDVLKYVHGLAQGEQRARRHLDAPATQVAVRELQRGRSLCGTGANSLAPFQQGRLSLPESVESPLHIGDVRGRRGRDFLEREGERMLKPVVEVMADLERDGTRRYCDPALVTHRTAHVTFFLKGLVRLGLLDFTLEPREDVGIFCAWKTGRERQRLTLDARRSNQRFRRPPSVDLISAEGLSSIEFDVGRGEEPDDELATSLAERLSVTAGVADVTDAFHRLRMPLFFRRCICFPAVRSGAVGLAGQAVEGVVLTGNEQVWPCPVASPMGFSWGLFSCQASGEELACAVPPLSSDSPLRGRGRPLALGCERGEALRHYIYVDNMGIVGAESERARSALDEVTEASAEKGLLVHGQAATPGAPEVLGVEIDGQLLQSRASGKRRLRARQAIAGLLQRGRCSESALEVVLGHVTFLAMARRPVLSFLHSCHAFAQKNYLVSARLCPSVVEELQVFAGLIVFLCSDWDVDPEFLEVPRVGWATEAARALPAVWETFAGHGQTLRAARAAGRSRLGAAAPSSSSSTGTASEGAAPPAGGRERVLWRRRKRRALAHVEEAWDMPSAGASLLEQKAAQHQARKQCQAELDRWRELANHGDLKLVSDESADGMLARYFERDFFPGEQAHRGAKLLAALMHAELGFGWCGSRRVPGAWRALKGLRRLAPGRSRRPEPLCLWAGRANEMASRGEPRMALFVLVSVSTYLRPSSLLALRPESFLAPKRPDGHWSLLAHPAERGVPDQIGGLDHSMLLDSRWLQFISPLLSTLSKQAEGKEAWGFAYYDYLRVFTECAKSL
ncbi:unnamed protein product, partial [Prorocentrum cordatum]